MAFPDAASLIDDFNRANGAIGSDYTQLGGTSHSLVIVSNTARSNSDGYSGSYYDVIEFGPDVHAWIGLPNHNVSEAFVYCSIWLRVESPTSSNRTGYTFSVVPDNGGSVRINRRNAAGTTTVLAEDTDIGGDWWASGANNRIGASAEGTVLKLWHWDGSSWTERLSYDTVGDGEKFENDGFIALDIFNNGQTHALENLNAGTVEDEVPAEEGTATLSGGGAAVSVAAKHAIATRSA